MGCIVRARPASSGMVETLDQAREWVAAAFRRNIAVAGLAERPGAPAGPPVYDPPPNDLVPWEEPVRDRWFDRDHSRVIDWPRRASVYSGELVIGSQSLPGVGHGRSTPALVQHCQA